MQERRELAVAQRAVDDLLPAGLLGGAGGLDGDGGADGLDGGEDEVAVL